jgi:hypothetical protein
MAQPGRVFIAIGDSRIAYPVGHPSYACTDQLFGWVNGSLLWFAAEADTAWLGKFGDNWFAGQAQSLGFFTCGVGGATLESGWNVNGGGNYYNGSGADPNVLEQVTAAVGDSELTAVDDVIVMLGPNSVLPGSTSSAATYRDLLLDLANEIVADMPGTPRIWLDIFSRREISGWDDDPEDPDLVAGMNAVRQGTLDAIAAHGSLYLGANFTGQDYDDGVHYNAAQRSELARAWYCAIVGTPAPSVLSTHINAAADAITVTVDRALSNAVESSVGGFRVFDNGSSVTIASQTVIDARQVLLELASPIAGAATCSFGSGLDHIGVTIPLGVVQATPDGGSYAAPMVPFFGRAASPEPTIGTGRL